jgi:hypothetical protein
MNHPNGCSFKHAWLVTAAVDGDWLLAVVSLVLPAQHSAAAAAAAAAAAQVC